MSYAQHYHAKYDGSPSQPEDEHWGSAAGSFQHSQAASSVTYALPMREADGQHWFQHSAAYSQPGPGFNATTAAAAYAAHYAPSQGYLPAPTSPACNRVSTNPGDYRQSHTQYAYSGGDMGSAGWTTTVAEHHSPALSYSHSYYGQKDNYSASESDDAADSPDLTKAEPVFPRGGSFPAREAPGSESFNSTPQIDAPNAPTGKVKPHICRRVSTSSPRETCYKAFHRKADLQRHERSVHDKDKQDRINCTIKNCSRKAEHGFLRKDHLTEHLRNFHNKDIPKKGRRTSAAQQHESQDEDEEDHQSMAHHYPQYQYTGP